VYVHPDIPGESCEDYIVRKISPLLGNSTAYVVVGCSQSLEGDCPTANLAITIAPGGSIVGTYGKQHPVMMIGERSCLKNGYRNYSINPMFVNGQTLSFSTLICYDTDFEDSSSIVADLGASLILNPSEDWSAARGHFAAAVFRAVENRVAIAKADWGWDSAIIQPNGEITAAFNSKTIHREVLTSDVLMFRQSTHWNRVRLNIFPLMNVIICLSLWYVGLRRSTTANRGSALDIETRLL
jgi:predicted amidohydrolase